MLYNQPFDQPGSPNAPYVNGNPATGTPGSIPPAAAFEYPQREIVNLITDTGLTPSNADLHQLGEAIQSGGLEYGGVDTGGVNAMVVTLTPVPTALRIGMVVRVKIATANTGATTLNVNGLGAKPCKTTGGAAFVGGELLVAQMANFEYDGTNFQLMSQSGTLFGGFRNFQVFTSSGSFTPPVGCTKIYYEVWGGGGGGGASGTSGFGAPGGGGGGHVRGTAAVTPGSALTITVGAGGASGTISGNGGAGGASSVGALATANGGQGGTSVGAGTGNSSSVGGSGGGSASGQSGNLTLAGQGTYGTNSSGGGVGSDGGNTWGFGGAINYASGQGAPNVAYGYGAGGNGAQGGVTTPSNSGAPGLVIIWF